MGKLKSALPFIIAPILAFSQASSACDIHGKTGIIPKNNLNIPVGMKFLGGGINEAQFNKVIDKVNALYSSYVTSLGGTLTFVRNWNDGTVNAYADRDDAEKIWTVSMYGGLARHPQMTEDAFAIVVCHELGHHIGGAPKKTDENDEIRWASSEGQADYYATLKCLRNYFADENNQDAVKNLSIPPLVIRSCQKSFANANEIAICERSAMAGLSLGNFFKATRNSPDNIDFATPDPSRVRVAYEEHPAPQCRLDTYFQGSLCDKSTSEQVSNTDPNIGACSEQNGDKMGNRPRCWFSEIHM